MSNSNKTGHFPPAKIIISTGLILAGGIAFFILISSTVGEETAVSRSVIPIEVDYVAPDLVLVDLDGSERSLIGYHGKVVLVNLWATWCPPCKAEMPALNRYYETYKAEGFVIVAVNDGEKFELVDDFVQGYGLTFPIWLDPKNVATERVFKTINLPSSYLIDREGIMRLQWVGAINRSTLEKYVTPIIME